MSSWGKKLNSELNDERRYSSGTAADIFVWMKLRTNAQNCLSSPVQMPILNMTRPESNRLVNPPKSITILCRCISAIIYIRRIILVMSHLMLQWSANAA